MLHICFVGSGIVNFGGSENPWNHSLRLEQLGGMKVVAIVDPLTEKASEILSQKLAGSSAHYYKDCVVYPDVDSALKEKRFQIAFIGI